jgi:hypothetical protein
MKLIYKQTGIEITADAFSNITNEIRFAITSPLSDGALLKDLFNYQFNLVDDKLIYGGMITIPNMSNMLNAFKIEQTDLGKTVNEALATWLIGIIYNENLLQLNLIDWQLM